MKRTVRCTKIMGSRFQVRTYGTIVLLASIFYLSINYGHFLHPNSRIGNVEQSFKETSEINLSSMKVKVLLRTNYFGSDILGNHWPTEILSRTSKSERILKCPKSKVVCSFTESYEEVDAADAVLFNARAVWKGFGRNETDTFPKPRRQDQPWIFFHREPPVHSVLDLKQFPDVFNWTMTYRSDSDVPFPYGKIVKRKEKKYEQIQLNRSYPIAWTVSNCKAHSNRNELVRQLKEHIRVDVYGKCGDHKCPANITRIRSQSQGCHSYLEKLYKFYLSFENSLCSEYVTEKFFNALNSQMIPVVYGRADYASIAPPNSFINVQDYNSTKELAEYLLWLADNPEEYAKYFEWKKDWEVVETDWDAWCSLCDKIAVEKASGFKQRMSYSDLNSWWFSEVGHNLTDSQTLKRSNGVLQQRGGNSQNELRPACVKPTIIKKNSH